MRSWGRLMRNGWGIDRFLAMAAAGLALALAAPAFVRAQEAKAPAPRPVVVWNVPEIDRLPDDEHGRLVRYGRSIIEQTAAHIGPSAADPSQRFAGNNLACADCHLDAGLKKFGLPLVAASADYPAYRVRLGAVVSLPDRLNACMTRSMNGRPMPADARPMQALVAYLGELSTNIPADAKIAGGGAGAMPELTRAADPVKGETVFAQVCAECHRRDGLGVRHNPADPSFGYSVPPLWGPDSFNDGAGMARLITQANFVHNNMPNGTSWVMPQVSVEESWDVAAYVISQPRPARASIDTDFPDLLTKPVDAAYGPFADSFPAAQHKYGPFAPIRAELAKLKAEKGSIANPNDR